MLLNQNNGCTILFFAVLLIFSTYQILFLRLLYFSKKDPSFSYFIFCTIYCFHKYYSLIVICMSEILAFQAINDRWLKLLVIVRIFRIFVDSFLHIFFRAHKVHASYLWRYQGKLLRSVFICAHSKIKSGAK